MSVFLLPAVSAVAQYWPKPAATPGVDVPCTGCIETHNGKLTPGYPSTIKTFTGRFLDSEATQDYQQPFKTARSESVVVVPSLHRVYMQVGSALFAYSLDTFFTRLASNEPLMSAYAIPTVSAYASHQPPPEMLLSYDEWFYAEHEPDNGWTAPTFDGQRRLQGFDYDDQGYVYLAYSAFGWGIVKDGLTTSHPGPLMHSMHQQYFSNADDVQPFGIAVVKSTAGRYYALIMSGNGPNNLYDVTDRTNPVHLPSFNKYIVTYAKTAAMDRIALCDGSNVSIYSADAIATGNWSPMVTFRSAGGQMNGVASDGTNFYASSDSGPGGMTISVFSPSGNTYTRTDYPVGGAFMTTIKLNYNDGYLTLAATTGAPTLRVFKMTNGVPVEIDLKNYIQSYYFQSPSAQYTHPNFTMFYASPSAGNTCEVAKYNNHTYLIVTAWGLGDVYELPNADGITVNSNGVAGTPNGRVPAGSATGPFYGDSVSFTAVTGAAAPMSLTWDFGDGGTGAGTTGAPITHQFAGSATGAAVSRTVKATNVNDSSISSTVTVNIAKPTVRFGVSSKFLFVQPNASSPAPIVAGDSFFDASDGVVEGHSDSWVVDGATTNTTPAGTVPVGACGAHSLAFTATYGPAAGAVPLGISPFNYTVKPFAAAVDVGTADATNINFISLSRASADSTALTNPSLNYKWELLDGNNSVVLAGPAGSATADAIPTFPVNRQTFNGRQNLKAHLVLSSTNVGAACAAYTSSEAFSRALNAPDFAITGGCTNGGPPCTYGVGSTNTDPTADGWTYAWSVSPQTAAPLSGTGATFSPTFTAPNTYTISLTATNAIGQTTHTKTEVVTVAGPTCPAATPGLNVFVGFNQSGSSCTQVGGTCNAGVPINFSVGTFNYDAACVSSVSWNFGDGSAASTARSVSHTYTANGSYTVTLTVTPTSGAPFSTTAPVSVGGIQQPPPPPPPPPTPSGGCGTIIPGLTFFVGYNQATSTCTQVGGSCNANSPINFIAGAYAYSFDCGTHGFSWSFGDGTTSSQQNPQHTYTNSGTYNVVLTITPPGGGPVQSNATVVVGNGQNPGPTPGPPPPPTPGPSGSCSPIIPNVTFFVTYTGPTSGCSQLSGDCTTDETIPFVAQAYNYDFGCATHTFQWDFGDGSAPVTGKTASHRYVNAGTYNLRLTITVNGQSYPVTQAVKVGSSSPIRPVLGAFDFASTAIPGVANGYVFTVTALGTTSASNVTFTWDFGDGHIDTTTNPQDSHIYADSKVYTVTLTVSGYSGSITHPAQTNGRHRIVHH